MFFIYTGFIPNLNKYAQDIDVDEMLMNLIFISEEFLMDELRSSVERLLLNRLSVDNAPSIFMAIKDDKSNQKLALACALTIMRGIKSERISEDLERSGINRDDDDEYSLDNDDSVNICDRNIASKSNMYEVSIDHIHAEVLEYLVYGMKKD